MKRIAYLLIVVFGLAIICAGCPSKDGDKPDDTKPTDTGKGDTAKPAEPAKPAALSAVKEVEPNDKTGQAMEIKEKKTW